MLLQPQANQVEEIIGPVLRPGCADLQPGWLCMPMPQNQPQAVGILLAPAQVFFQFVKHALERKQQPLGMFDFLHKIRLLPERVGRLPGCAGIWPGALDFLEVSQQFRRQPPCQLPRR